jgi:hypothetical protein
MSRPSLSHSTTLSEGKGQVLPHLKVEYVINGVKLSRHFPFSNGNPVLEERARARAEGFTAGLEDAIANLNRSEPVTPEPDEPGL